MSIDKNNILKYLSHATIYEVNLRQYTAAGDIISFMEHLPRLKDMGVDILWLMPIHPIGIPNRKGSLGSYYCSSDFFGLNPEYGTKEDFRKMINEIHRLGMKVIIDWVANHAAWDNQWTVTHPEYFKKNESGNFLSPYDWTDVIQIDHDNEEAHDAMRSAMCYWVKEFDIDGFRADLAHLTPLRFWIKARKLAEAIKPNLIWLAETEEPSYYEAFDIFYAWRWMHRTADFFRDSLMIDTLTDVLMHEMHLYPENALQLFFTSNHDENSWNGTEFEKYGIYAKALSVFSFFYHSSVPLIYSGQEIPNTRRLSFLDKDEIKWMEKPSLHDFFKTLISLRKKYAAGDPFSFIQTSQKVLAFKRGFGLTSLLVFLNLDSVPVDFIYQHDEDAGFYQNIFNSDVIMSDKQIQVRLNPGEFWVMEKIKNPEQAGV